MCYYSVAKTLQKVTLLTSFIEINMGNNVDLSDNIRPGTKGVAGPAGNNGISVKCTQWDCNNRHFGITWAHKKKTGSCSAAWCGSCSGIYTSYGGADEYGVFWTIYCFGCSKKIYRCGLKAWRKKNGSYSVYHGVCRYCKDEKDAKDAKRRKERAALERAAKAERDRKKKEAEDERKKKLLQRQAEEERRRREAEEERRRREAEEQIKKLQDIIANMTKIPPRQYNKIKHIYNTVNNTVNIENHFGPINFPDNGNNKVNLNDSDADSDTNK
mmetsp:Transcript_75990/g.93300  ORF Transcript_75990/g.93300 Transcript_75990/m.93300 type:complete len:271 (+) Transcript_75990:21-833(+)